MRGSPAQSLGRATVKDESKRHIFLGDREHSKLAPLMLAESDKPNLGQPQGEPTQLRRISETRVETRLGELLLRGGV